MTSFLGPVRAAYDAIAPAYVDRFGHDVEPHTQELLTALAEHAGPDGPVLDVGCGAGRTTAFLTPLTRVVGLDLSLAMLRQAPAPARTLLNGSMTALPVADGRFAGLLAWYSVIHVPPPALPAVLAEFRRVLRPGGMLVLAFQAGDEVSHHERPFGQDTPLDFQRYQADRVANHLTDAGFRVDRARTRPADPTVPGERTPQAFLTGCAQS